MTNERTVDEWLEKLRHLLRLDRMPAFARKIVVSLAGGVILLAGVVMLVTPGPAVLFIPLGVLIFACEFAWAKRLAEKLGAWLIRARLSFRQWRARRKARALAGQSK